MKEVDINYSDWDNQLEPPNPLKGALGAFLTKGNALRLGFRQVKGLREEDIKLLITGRTKMYSSINELRDIGLPEATLGRLADADAFRSIGLDRRLLARRAS